MISAESSRTVNGPSLHNSTCISAPNMPDSTTDTRSRQYALQDVYKRQHLGDAELEIGRVCVQLASPDFKFMTGETITLEGGLGLRP